LTLLTNPIDDQGYCSTAEKLELVASFVRHIANVLVAKGTVLVIKPHARESAKGYLSALNDLPSQTVRVVPDVPLYPMLAASTAAVTLASTAGLEALLFDLPLGVLEIPGAGYLHDYVSSGAAWGIGSNGSSGERVREMLLAPERKRDAARAYLHRQLARRTGAGEKVTSVIMEALG
jgi:hypothetical protein